MTVLGIVAAVAVSGLLQGLLFGVSATAPWAYAAVAAVLGAIALAATALPVHRAASIDPVSSLRWGGMVVALLAAPGGAGATAAAQARAEVFAPDVVSAGNVYRGSFTPDGRTLFFFKRIGSAASEEYRIFRSRLVGGAWSRPDTVQLGAAYHSDLYPAISADGRRLVFSSYRPVPGARDVHNAHLWYADATADGWGEPVFIGVSEPGYYHPQPQLLRDGSLVFKRISPDWRTQQQFIARWDGQAYRSPVPLPVYERWKAWREDLTLQEATLAPDGSYALLMIAQRNAAGRAGPPDIWVTLRGTDWSEPRPLGAGVNSAGTENFPFFSADGATLYFVRDFGAFYRVDAAAAIGGLTAPPGSPFSPHLLPEAYERARIVDRMRFAQRMSRAEQSSSVGLGGEARSVVHGLATTEARVIDVSYPAATDFDTHAHEEGYLCPVTEGDYVEWEPSRERGEHRFGDDLVLDAGSRHAVRTGPTGCRIIHVTGGRARARTGPLTAGILWQIARTVERADLSHDSEILDLESLLHELEPRGAPARCGPWLAIVRERIRDEYRKDTSLADLADEADRHPAHVARAFKAAWGMTAGEYLRRVRVAAAVRLLRDSDEPIAWVALATGFADQSHLGRWMRRYVGHTPGAIRNRGGRGA